MKAPFSEVYYNKSHSENSGSGGSGGSGGEAVMALAVAWITLTFHPFWLLPANKTTGLSSFCMLLVLVKGAERRFDGVPPFINDPPPHRWKVSGLVFLLVLMKVRRRIDWLAAAERSFYCVMHWAAGQSFCCFPCNPTLCLDNPSCLLSCLFCFVWIWPFSLKLRPARNAIW